MYIYGSDSSVHRQNFRLSYARKIDFQIFRFSKIRKSIFRFSDFRKSENLKIDFQIFQNLKIWKSIFRFSKIWKSRKVEKSRWKSKNLDEKYCTGAKNLHNHILYRESKAPPPSLKECLSELQVHFVRACSSTDYYIMSRRHFFMWKDCMVIFASGIP